MSAVSRTTIGFDRSIDIEWLDAEAARAAKGQTPAEIKKFLWDFLENVVPGNTNNSGRGKTLTVLSRIWITVPAPAKRLREAALRCFESATCEQRVAIHWAMAVGTQSVLLRCRYQCWETVNPKWPSQPVADQASNDRNLGRPFNFRADDSTRTPLHNSMEIAAPW